MKTKQSNTNLKFLNEENHLAYYLVGFLLADGSLNRKRIRCCISYNDSKWFKKAFSILNVQFHIHKEKNYNTKQIYFAAMDTKEISKIINKFDFKENKTKNPPNIKQYEKFEEEMLTSLIIGFIDGDGCIQNQYKRKDCTLTIKLHKSWLTFLNLIHKKIENILNIKTPKPKIDNAGYSKIIFSNTKILRHLKKHAMKNNLPYMERKWNKIDENRISKYEICEEKTEIIKQMIKEGFSQTEIAKKLNMSDSGIVSLRKRKNINYKRPKK